jgi:hypothetical protein
VHGRLELRTLVGHAFEGIINLDTRALRTIGELTIDPGTVCRDYIDGRRKPYVNPFKYAFATFTFTALVSEALIYLHGVSSDPHTAKLDAFQARWDTLINFAAMPVLAAVLSLLFISAPKRRSWVEHYVLVLFTFGHIALLQGLLAPLIEHAGGIVATMVFTGLPIVLLSWAAIDVYQTRWWTTIPRVLVAFVVIQVIALGVVRLVAPEIVGES